jgi:IclR family KDG regulon transcriptional repressor
MESEKAVVKSVYRVFKIFELFDSRRMPMNAAFITRKLKYPQSSTMALLKSMVSLGYLSFDREDHTYMPTMRLPIVSRWLESSLYGEGHLFSLIDEVSAETGETIGLVCQNDLAIQILLIRMGVKPLTLHMAEGALLPLFQSTPGLVALSEQPDDRIAKAADRINQKSKLPKDRVNLPSAMQRIRKIRTLGYGVAYDFHIEGIGALAWAIPPHKGKRRVILTISGPTSRMREEEAVNIRIVKSALKRYINY